MPEFALRVVEFVGKAVAEQVCKDESLAWLRACSELGEMDQLTINEYVPGQGISPHVDTHSSFGDVIVSVSLGSGAVMNFARASSVLPAEAPSSLSLYLPARSILIMSGEARLAYSHGIPLRKTDSVEGELIRRSRRVSFTFRTVRCAPCACRFPDACDSQSGVLKPTRLAEEADACRAVGQSDEDGLVCS